AGRELNILADGDSWFSYLLSRDVIQWIQADGNPSPEILNLAVAGDPVTATLGVTKRQRIVDNLRNRPMEISMLCFSLVVETILRAINFVFGLLTKPPEVMASTQFR